MQNGRSIGHEPDARTVGIRELSERIEEIVREVQATGRPVDITIDGETVVRLSPAAERRDPDQRRRAARTWLEETEAFAQEIARRWPSPASSVDLVRDLRRDL
jgi:prevent-host-death family protein